MSGYRGSDRYGDGGTVLRPVEVPVAPLAIDTHPRAPRSRRELGAAGEGGRRERGRRRLLKWGRPNLHLPAYSPGHVELPVGRIVTRPGPNRFQVIVGKVESVRDIPAGLEATIRLKDNAEGADTAHEMPDGYLPAPSC